MTLSGMTLSGMTLSIPMLLGLASLGLGPSAHAAGLRVVDAAGLDAYWRPAGTAAAGSDLMTIGNDRDTSYGCIAMGYLIDRDGRITSVRPLRRAFAADVPAWRATQLTGVLVTSTTALAHYVPGPGNAGAAEVFTAVNLVFVGRRLGERLDASGRRALADAIRPHCAIEDLAAWVGDHDMRQMPDVEPLPRLHGPAAR